MPISREVRRGKDAGAMGTVSLHSSPATQEEYALAAEHIRTVAAEAGVMVR
jgi:hypothetical protein